LLSFLKDVIELYKEIYLIIILAGINDLPHNFSTQEITNNIIKLHKFCHEKKIITCCLTIPSNLYVNKFFKVIKIGFKK
jgi:hypothetical protein